MTKAATYDIFISHADAERAWVEGYLLDALVQAGVRCHSEAAFALGVPRLLEFEHAIQKSQRTLLVISPAYLADGFSQFTDFLAQSYGLETATWPVIPLILHPVKLPPRLAMLTALDATNPAHQQVIVERLCAELQRLVPGPASKLPCPYPGMVPFSEDMSDRFFGRDQEVQELLERLRLHPFLTVIGPSGSGKSSLVFAGLIPALRRSGLFGSGDWLIRTMRPGEAPLAALATTLGSNPVNSDLAVTDVLATQSNAQRLLIVIDQFEELFTLSSQDLVPFQQTLQRFVKTRNCYLVLTVRADFYPDLMAAPLWREVQAHRIEVVPLDAAGLRQAIIKPAEDVGVFVETALVERLVVDAAGEPGVLPLIQETLVLLWERVERRFLPLRAYEALVLPPNAYGALGGGQRTGLQVAIARRADATLADLSEEQQAIARRVFLRLVQFGEGRADTRRQQPVDALRAVGDNLPLFNQTLRHLTDNRLLTLSGGEGDSSRKVDIAHEALISGWPTLQQWITERREAEQTRRRLEAKAAEWVRLGRGSSGLLDDVELTEAERWLTMSDAADLGYDEALPALVQASRKNIESLKREKEAAQQRELKQAQALAEEQRQRAKEQADANKKLRYRLWMAVSAFAIAFLFAIGAFVGFRNSERERQIAFARQLAAQAQLIQSEDANLLQRSTLLAVESMERFRNLGVSSLQADQTLRQGLALLPRLIAQVTYKTYKNDKGNDPTLRAFAFSSDGKHIATASDAIRELKVTNKQEVAHIRYEKNLKVITLSPDGKYAAMAGEDNTVKVWELTRRQEVAHITHDKNIEGIFFSQKSRYIAIESEGATIRVRELTSGKEVTPTEITIKLIKHSDAIIFSPDEKYIAVVSPEESTQVWSLTSGQEVMRLKRGLALWYRSGTAFSSDGKLFAASPIDATAQVWEVPSGREIMRAQDTAWLTTVTLSPDGKYMATGNREGEVQVWEVPSGKKVARMIHGPGWLSDVVFSPNGKYLATTGLNKIARVYEVLSGREVARMSHERNVIAVAFSPDGKYLATQEHSGQNDNLQFTVRVWEATSDPEVALVQSDGRVSNTNFSLNGKYLAIAEGGNLQLRS